VGRQSHAVGEGIEHDDKQNGTKMSLNVRFSQSGLHLFDRVSGTNVLVDEVSFPPGKWHRAPRQISIALTNACDLSCAYCYAPKHPAALKFSQIVNWVDELSAAGCLGIGFGGGEPTLHGNFIDLCRHVSAHSKIAVTFTTHGHHLDEALIDELKGSVHFVRISMDGVDKTYEELRGRPFENLLIKLRLAERLCPFGINFVVNSRTICDLGAAVTIAAEFGANELLLLPQRPNRLTEGVSQQVMTQLREWVSGCQGPVRLAISELDSHGFTTCNPAVKETGLRAFAHVDASGLLKACSYDECGIEIGTAGILSALDSLRHLRKES
jgi:sulfatase maturation enzyme AslB (radical SAM superfamily)